LQHDWKVTGVSRSQAPVNHASFTHHVCDVSGPGYFDMLRTIITNIDDIDMCLYCPGIGRGFDPTSMETESVVFEVNLLGLVKTAMAIIPVI